MPEQIEEVGFGIVAVPNAALLPPGNPKTTLMTFGVQGWACVSLLMPGRSRGILGFDTFRPACGVFFPRPVVRLAGDAIGAAIERDLSERDRVELAARLERALRMQMVGQLASGVAHNFNNIIAAMQGYSEMAGAEIGANAKTAPHLAEIQRAAERGRDLIDSILSFGLRSDARTTFVRRRRYSTRRRRSFAPRCRQGSNSSSLTCRPISRWSARRRRCNRSFSTCARTPRMRWKAPVASVSWRTHKSSISLAPSATASCPPAATCISSSPTTTRRWRVDFSSRETPDDAPTDWLGVLHLPAPPVSSRLGIIAPMEGRRWSVSLCVNHGETPPSDIDGFMAFAKSLRMPTIYNAIRSAKHVGDIARFGMPCSVRRAFDKLVRFPRGLVPLGDSVCRFPPVQGQGMSVAAQECGVLASLLESRPLGNPLDGLAEAFFTEIQPLLETSWAVAMADLVYPQTRGERPPDFEEKLRYTRALMRLAAEDAETDRILFPKDRVRTEGPNKVYLRGGNSGRKIECHFCPDCGSTVFWRAEFVPDLIGVAFGAFADPSMSRPTLSVRETTRHPWVTFDYELDHFVHQPELIEDPETARR